MKTTLTIIAAVAFATTTAVSVAQTPAPSPAPTGSKDCSGKKHRKHDGGGRTAALNLTPDQKARFEALRADRRSKLDAIQSNAALTPEQKKEQVKGLREASRAQLEAILTPEQTALLKQAKSERKGHHKKGGEAAPQATPTA